MRPIHDMNPFKFASSIAAANNEKKFKKHFESAEEKFSEGRYQEAINSWHLAITFLPGGLSNEYAYTLYIEIAKCHMIQGNFQEAIENYSNSIQLNPTDSHSYITRGCLRKKLGEISEAKEDLRRAVELGDERGLEVLEQWEAEES